METASFSVLELFKLGGVIMWPLLVFSIAVVAIAIERGVYLAYHNLEVDDLETSICEYTEKKDYQGACDYLEGLTKKRMGARVLLAIMKQMKSGTNITEHRLEKAAETEAIKSISLLENSFNFLVAIGSLSPLTGFLGTVTGMIGAFRSIAEATEVNAQIVANGIYEALITTVFGLIIAIIAMIAHSIYSHIVDRFAGKIENACTNVISQVSGN